MREEMDTAQSGFTGVIRLAVLDDVPAVKKIASQHNKELGFVIRSALIDSISRSSLIVATQLDEIVGFANYRRRKDGVNVIYELGVHRNHLRKRIGSALLSAIPYPTRLKTTTDNQRALAFYLSNGFTIVGHERGRKRELHVLERH